MNHQHLLELLKKAGIIHEDQGPGFAEMVKGIQNDRRIVCAEYEEKDRFHGISFWIYGEKDDWFIGLWSGVYFKVQSPDRIPELAAKLLSGKIVKRGRPPGDLPSRFKSQYGLVEQPI